MSICGNMVGGLIIPKSFVLEDENGTSLVGVTVGEETVLTAQASDIKIGKVAATDNGITEGTDTKTYHTTVSTRLILPGKALSIPCDSSLYNYTKLQCVVVLYSSNYDSTAETVYITINDSVFSTETSEKLSDITKNSDTQSIDLNLTNDTENIYSIRYFFYHEEVEE